MLQMVSSILVMIAMPLVASPKYIVYGLAIMALSQIGWAICGWTKLKSKFLVIQSIYLFIFNIKGMINFLNR